MNEIDLIYMNYAKTCPVPDNFDFKIFVYEYSPYNENKHVKIFEGYFPYPRLFPIDKAHLFPKFMLSCEGNILDEDGNVAFKPDKGRYYIFVLVYQFYSKHYRVKSKKYSIWYGH